MSYIVVSDAPKDAARGVLPSVVRANLAVLSYKTKEEAAREASHLNREAQAQQPSVVAPAHYWVEYQAD